MPLPLQANVLKFWSLTFDDCLMFAKSQPANIRQGCKGFLGENTLVIHLKKQ